MNNDYEGLETDFEGDGPFDEEKYEKTVKALKKRMLKYKIIKTLLLSILLCMVVQIIIDFKGGISVVLWLVVDSIIIGGSVAWIITSIKRFIDGDIYWEDNLGMNTYLLPPGLRMLNEFESGKFRWGEITLIFVLLGLTYISCKDFYDCFIRLIRYYI